MGKVGNPNWEKGVSGNPKGRPKGISITGMIKAKLDECPEGQDKKTYADLVIQSILKKALKDNDTNMLKTIWAYIDGQPTQKIGGDSDNPIQAEIKISFMDD